MKTGIANLPLHGGKAPAWLFQRMSKLARAICETIIIDYGTDELLKKLSDPFWFQSFGCVLGFDWHSSGLTTTTCGAIKDGLKPLMREYGFYVAGGKGGASRKTPSEIEAVGDHIGVDPADLVYSSRIVAKVDSAAVIDGYQLYHHVFFFNKSGQWAVIQQGMNEQNRFARRYHWLSDILKSFTIEPHFAICASKKDDVIDLTASDSLANQKCITFLAGEPADKTIDDLEKILRLDMPRRHQLFANHLKPESVKKILLKNFTEPPADFEKTLMTPGVGPMTIRALSLVSEIAHGAPACFRDPAKFSFAHGGKDGFPFPVRRDIYDSTIDTLRGTVKRSKIERSEKSRALARLDCALTL